MFLRLYKRLQCGVFLWLEQGVASGTPTLLSMNELHETKTELSNLHVLLYKGVTFSFYLFPDMPKYFFFFSLKFFL